MAEGTSRVAVYREWAQAREQRWRRMREEEDAHERRLREQLESLLFVDVTKALAVTEGGRDARDLDRVTVAYPGIASVRMRSRGLELPVHEVQEKIPWLAECEIRLTVR